MSSINKLTRSVPSGEVLRAFGVGGEIANLNGGQGNVFACEDVVFKPVGDEAEAIWSAETQLDLAQRGFRLARPLTSVSGSVSDDLPRFSERSAPASIPSGISQVAYASRISTASAGPRAPPAIQAACARYITPLRRRASASRLSHQSAIAIRRGAR